MPESTSLILERYDRAVSELEDFFRNTLTARRLVISEINTAYQNRNFSCGWQLEVNTSKGQTKLNVLITNDFPFVPPLIGIVPPPAPLTYPHIENDGILCLLSNSASVSSYQPVEVTHHLLSEAVSLLNDCFAGKNVSDFRKEFLSYWNRDLTDENFKFVSLLNPVLPSRVIKVWRGTRRYVFGENESAIQSWIKNGFDKKNNTFESAALIWLPQLMLPSEYPKTNNDLWKLINNQKDSSKILEKLFLKSTHEIFVLLGGASELGSCLAGVTLYKPQNGKAKYNKTNYGHKSSSIDSVNHLESSNKVGRYQVERADPAWVHGRDNDKRQQDLSSKTVVILGCGSIGGFVAKILATLGIGKFLFIDPEKLSRANTGRHFLGARYVGYPKAECLAKELRENHPHLAFDYRNASWKSIAKTDLQTLAASDLIISTIGDWTPEGMLNEWQQTLNDPPSILYGWTEAFALAGHAVGIFKGKGCLQCHMNEFGAPDLKVINLNGSETLKQEPACGVMYQPYGPIELNNTVNLISELALDILLEKVTSSSERIWACRRSLLEVSSANWSNDWLELVNGNEEGGFSITRKWNRINSCKVC